MPAAVVPVLVLAVILIIVVCSCVKIVPQATTFIVERLGAYKTTWETGIHFKQMTEAIKEDMPELMFAGHLKYMIRRYGKRV